MAHVVPGLEELAWEEIRGLDEARSVGRWTGFDKRAGVLVFSSGAAARELLDLRLTEDVFAVVSYTKTLPEGRPALRALARLVQGEGMEASLSAHREAAPRKKRGRPSFRVVVRRAGRHGFRRLDAQRVLERAIVGRFARWRLSDGAADVEFWLQIIGGVAIVALRLSADGARRRPAESRPARLKPAVAHALAWLARPRRRASGMLVDPMCGTGAVLGEAASLGLPTVGGDIDRAALRAARRNVPASGLALWDAGKLPLASGAAAAVACNLPWGRTHAVSGLADLYRCLLDQAGRVVVDGGAVVLLTSDRALLERQLRRQPALVVERRIPVVVRGADAWIFALRRAG